MNNCVYLFLGDEHPSMRSGLWVLAGVLIFTIVEKIFSGYTSSDENNPQPKCIEIANCLLKKTGGKIPVDMNGDDVKCGACDIEDIPNGSCLLAEHKKAMEDKVKGQSRKVCSESELF